MGFMVGQKTGDADKKRSQHRRPDRPFHRGQPFHCGTSPSMTGVKAQAVYQLMVLLAVDRTISSPVASFR